ncbi:hypothetical protein CBR_g27783 [Chara braunii]|uniref:Uncharacterized protein n=1 Tax=Chara braunii TaxID=69332 RepID=A0A388L8C0_CHABU|nr:hypothetical protein CBR_g27783 [Chara braunii]|eukprot:GBG78559.1 hypothetical protein CBR_g27783 [Chara braunii]
MFIDLNVVVSGVDECTRRELVGWIVKLGYHGLAEAELELAHVALGRSATPRPLIDKASALSAIPGAEERARFHTCLLEKKRDASSATATPAFRHLRRITLKVDDVAYAQHLSGLCPALSEFDVIAAEPSNVNVLEHLCQNSQLADAMADLSTKRAASAENSLPGRGSRSADNSTTPVNGTPVDGTKKRQKAAGAEEASVTPTRPSAGEDAGGKAGDDGLPLITDGHTRGEEGQNPAAAVSSSRKEDRKPDDLSLVNVKRRKIDGGWQDNDTGLSEDAISLLLSPAVKGDVRLADGPPRECTSGVTPLGSAVSRQTRSDEGDEDEPTTASQADGVKNKDNGNDDKSSMPAAEAAQVQQHTPLQVVPARGVGADQNISEANAQLCAAVMQTGEGESTQHISSSQRLAEEACQRHSSGNVRFAPSQQGIGKPAGSFGKIQYAPSQRGHLFTPPIDVPSTRKPPQYAPSQSSIGGVATQSGSGGGVRYAPSQRCKDIAREIVHNNSSSQRCETDICNGSGDGANIPQGVVESSSRKEALPSGDDNAQCTPSQRSSNSERTLQSDGNEQTIPSERSLDLDKQIPSIGIGEVVEKACAAGRTKDGDGSPIRGDNNMNGSIDCTHDVDGMAAMGRDLERNGAGGDGDGDGGGGSGGIQYVVADFMLLVDEAAAEPK